MLSPVFPFNEETVRTVPGEQGVYGLFQDDALIYVGSAAGSDTTIRSRLMDHLQNGNSLGEYRVTHYDWLVTSQPVYYEQTVLQECRKIYGCLPCLNARNNHKPAGA